MSTAPASASEAMEMVHAGLGYLAAADATRDGGRDPGPVPADAGAGPLDRHRGADLDPGRVHRRPGLLRGRGLQPAGVADQPDPGHQGHRGRATPRGSGGPRAHPEVAAALAAGEISESFARTICTWTGKLPQDCREAADAILLDRGAGRAGPARTWPGWPGRSTPGRCPRTPTRTGTSVRGPVGPAGDDVRRRRGPAWRPYPGVRARWWARCWMRCRPRRGGG